MVVRPYNEADSVIWDEFCADAYMSTFLHTRRFLSYHGQRFRDLSLVLEGDGRLLALLPAAYDPDDATHVISHPGVTYGGILHQGALRGARMLQAFELVCSRFASMGCRRFTYKAIPNCYHRTAAQEDLYALFRLNATRSRCDLSSVINLRNRLAPSPRRRRSARKAAEAGVEVAMGRQFAAALWPVVQDNLGRKHGKSPVHSDAEIQMLADRFPENIQFVVGLLNGRVEAGVVLFISPGVHHAQYIAASQRGYDACALDAIFEHCISKAMATNAEWFDFGVSTASGGSVLNDGLNQFKIEFGGGGMVHEFYEMALAAPSE